VREIEVFMRPNLGGVTLFISVIEIQELDLTKDQRFETFEHLEDLLTLKIVQAQGGKDLSRLI
jgi:hypothetical protein